MPKRQAKKQLSAMTASEADARMDYLLDVAAQMFLEQGFEGTSVGEIARRAKASKETFYSKYKNKDEIFRTVMTRLMGRFGSELTSSLDMDVPPEAALSSFGTLMLARILSDEAIGLQKIVYMESGRFPEVAEIFFELGPKRTTNALISYLNAQVKLGNMRQMDSTIASAHFIGLLTSDLMMRKSLGQLIKPSPKERAYRVKAAVEVFLRAYGRDV